MCWDRPQARNPFTAPWPRSWAAAIVSVDYRLAPETRYPGAVEDCYAALAWLFANAAELKVDPARVGVMGESAGGGLAAALALMMRDRGEYHLAFPAPDLSHDRRPHLRRRRPASLCGRVRLDAAAQSFRLVGPSGRRAGR